MEKADDIQVISPTTREEEEGVYSTLLSPGENLYSELNETTTTIVPIS